MVHKPLLCCSQIVTERFNVTLLLLANRKIKMIGMLLSFDHRQVHKKKCNKGVWRGFITILLYIRCINLFAIPKTLIFIRGHIKYLFCEFYSHDSKTKTFCYHWKASHLTSLWNIGLEQFGNGLFMNFFIAWCLKGFLLKVPLCYPSRVVPPSLT